MKRPGVCVCTGLSWCQHGEIARGRRQEAEGRTTVSKSFDLLEELC